MEHKNAPVVVGLIHAVFLTQYLLCPPALGQSSTGLQASPQSSATATSEEKASPPLPPTPLQFVGALGNPATLSFEGITTFTAKEITDGLAFDREYLRASQPEASLSLYLRTLQNKVQLGYRYHGFPDVQVATSLSGDGKRIVVKVSEGPQYACGQVKVVAAQSIPADLLVRRLTQTWPPADVNVLLPPVIERIATSSAKGDTELKRRFLDERTGQPTRECFAYFDGTGQRRASRAPLWCAGQPACFSERQKTRVKEEMKLALSQLGYFFPECEVEVLADKESKTAQLRVEILKEGPKATIETIRIVGNSRNTREDVLNCAGLQVGMECTSDLLTRAQYLLWRSARFLRHKVTPELSEGRAFGVLLDVTEYEAAPPLSQPLTPSDQMVLRFGDFLSDPSSWPEDAVLSTGAFTSKVPIEFLQVVLSPNKGILCTVKDQAAAAQRLNLSVVWSQPEGWALYSAPGRSKLVLSHIPGSVAFQMLAIANPEVGSEYPFLLRPGLGFTFESGGPRFISWTVQVAPVFCLHLSRKGESSLKDGVATIGFKGVRLRIDPASGRLLEATLGPTATLSFEKGAFDRLTRQLKDTSAHYHDISGRGQPISSLARFLLQEEALREALGSPKGAASVAVSPRATGVRHTLLAKALSPLDNLLFAPRPENRQSFSCDTDGSGADAALMSFVVKYANELLPYGSWPWSLVRFLAFSKTDPNMCANEWQRICVSPETGPIGFWVASTLFDSKMPSRPFAMRGLQRLSTADFQRDYRLLVEGESVIAQCLARAVEGLRELSEEEVELLGLSAERWPLIHRMVKALREHKDKSITAVLSPLLDAYWEDVLREQVETSLRPANKGRIPW